MGDWLHGIPSAVNGGFCSVQCSLRRLSRGRGSVGVSGAGGDGRGGVAYALCVLLGVLHALVWCVCWGDLVVSVVL